MGVTIKQFTDLISDSDHRAKFVALVKTPIIMIGDCVEGIVDDQAKKVTLVFEQDQDWTLDVKTFLEYVEEHQVDDYEIWIRYFGKRPVKLKLIELVLKPHSVQFG